MAAIRTKKTGGEIPFQRAMHKGMGRKLENAVIENGPPEIGAASVRTLRGPATRLGIAQLLTVWMMVVMLAACAGVAAPPAPPPPPPKVEVQPTPPPAPEPAFEKHVVAEGETLWSIAGARYRNSALWPYIYQANYERIPNPDVLENGTELILPRLKGEENNMTTKEQWDLATGYVRAFQAYRRTGQKDAAYFLEIANARNPGAVEKLSGEIAAEDPRYLARRAALWRSLFRELGLERQENRRAASPH